MTANTKPIELNTTIPDEAVGNLVISVGSSSVVLNSAMRAIRATQPFSVAPMSGGPVGQGDTTGAATLVPPFTSLMLDRRAPGLHTATVAGPAAKLEWLAEQMVEAGAVAAVARQLMSHDLIARVNERVLRGNARFKQGTVIMSYPGLFRTMLEVTGASAARNDPNRVAARVLTELLARVYAQFGVMMTYKPVFAQTYYNEPVASTGDLIRAAHVATITETLETLRIGGALREKEFAPAIVEATLGPALLSAANKLLAAEKYNRWMRDAAIITGLFLRNSADPVLDYLRDDANLMVLASNASWGFDAMAMSVAKAAPASPAHEHAELLAFAALRLRELRRYESVSMIKFAGMYSSMLVKTARGALAGVFVSRNVEIVSGTKATIFAEDSDIVIPMPSPYLDPYVPMLNDFTNGAFGGAATTNAAFMFAQHAIARAVENENMNARVVQFNVTDRELSFLAMALTKTMLVSMVGLGTTVHYGIHDGKAYYEGSAVYQGEYVYTSDPAEILILLGEDHRGSQKFTTKPQTFAEDMFTGSVDVINAEQYSSAARRITTQIQLDDGTEIDYQVSLYSLLTGDDEEPVMKSYIAVDNQMRDYVASALGLGLVCYNELAASGNPADAMMAEQIATGMHDLLIKYTRHAGFNQLLKTARIAILRQVQPNSAARRVLLGSVVARHALAVRLATVVMLRSGIIPFGMQSDVARLLSNSLAVERAATSDAFHDALTRGVIG